jgi:hypothetical protein
LEEEGKSDELGGVVNKMSWNGIGGEERWK